uniref:Uncharacterized protein n=1 Tax=Heliothis virescens TaxID=7102 RepID=A0A2A4K7X7_HELVI
MMEACCSRFTAAEGGARLAAAAATKNILAVEYASFIPVRLLYEKAYQIRGSLFEGSKRSVYITRASRVQVVAFELKILTDLGTAAAQVYSDVYDWTAELEKKEVVICTSSVLKQLLEEQLLSISNVNVLIIDSCHLIYSDQDLKYIMRSYKQCPLPDQPIILALTYPLFTTKKDLDKDNKLNTNDTDRQTEDQIVVDQKDIENDKEVSVNQKEMGDQLTVQQKETENDKQVSVVKNEMEDQTIVQQKETENKQISLNQKETADQNTVQQKEMEDDKQVSLNQKETEDQNTVKQSEIKDQTAKKETEQQISVKQGEMEDNNKKIIEINDTEDKNIVLKEELTERDGLTQVVKKEIEEEMGVYQNVDDFDMYEKLEWKIEELESELCCQMDLAEDIDGGKRTASSVSKPRELIIEYGSRPTDDNLPELYKDIDTYMRQTVQDALDFIEDHRHDPTEIYGEEMYDEFMSIPDPKIDPRLVFKQFLYVLDQLGPYAADKAAFALLTKLEKLKIKIPYERHFILMCLCTTVFLKIRCYAEMIFEKVDDEWERLKTFSSPKIMRFAEILEKFKPPDIRPNNSVNGKDSGDSKDRPNETVLSGCDNLSKGKLKKMLSDIEHCDFATLGDKIEDRVNTYACNLKDLDYPIEDYPLSINSQTILLDQDGKETDIPESTAEDTSNSSTIPPETTNHSTNDTDSAEKSISRTDSGVNIPDSCVNGPDSCVNQPDSRNNEVAFQQRGLIGFPRRAGYRMRGKSRMQRNNAARVLQMQQNPDALCGIVFMKEPLIAKIMFMVLVDMSRSNPHLSYLNVQYCGTELPADPGTEPRECLRQGKRQEDVLKKFRMHECNLLLATSALEEGIDLPRCNLVLRWDVPPSYRSYGLCRGRARAARATAALLCSNNRDTTAMLLQNVATYRELDQIISRKCGCGIQDEPPQTEEDHADAFTSFVKPYTPIDCSNSIPETKDIKDKDDGKDKDAISSKKDKFDNLVQEKALTNNLNSVRSSVDNNLVTNMDNANINSKNNNEDSAENIINNAVKTVNNVVKTVNEVINNVNEAVDIGINDLINHIIDETANLNVSDDIENDNGEISNNIDEQTSQNSETASSMNKSDFKKNINDGESTASVDLSTAIALINRYCGKLPSDTFTRLAPQWWMEEVQLPVAGSSDTRTAYICTLRLPLNCPVKYNIVGHPMPTKVLARRMVALQACRILHKSGELDNQLMPIGKENFKTAELGGVGSCPGREPEAGDSARPGTTKRRQYYYKRTAWAFTDCQPVIDATDEEIYPGMDPGMLDIDSDTEPPSQHEGSQEEREIREERGEGGGKKRNMLYAIVCKLWCALPERYNTRGRRLHAPQLASQAIGILMARHEPDRSVATSCKLWCALPERYNTRGRRLHAPQLASQAIGILMARHEPDRSVATSCKLWCALPERYNTRGRRLHAPQLASQAIGILMARHEPDRSVATSCKLWCALPERYNTRGRRLHAPQLASQAIGILMARHEPDRSVATSCKLWCALPERYNTRGRRLHAPQLASQAIGILMARHEPDRSVATSCKLWCALPERYNTRGRRLHAPQLASQAIGILMARHEPDRSVATSCKLWCALPERYNTRGRRLHAPQLASQAIGILMARHEPDRSVATSCKLWCALPERYNTRGRRLHAPQLASQAIGILMARHEPDRSVATSCKLWCALPERYNTRGRRLHAPQLASQAIGILMARHEPDRSVATSCKLWCALPERYNTRGRRLHAPQLASQAIGILMARHEPDRSVATSCKLWCALPERYNTRGRRLHAPQLASQAIGILMARHEPDRSVATSCKLWCALPERYNTRGRRLHAPQLASQAIGILMARHEPDRSVATSCKLWCALPERYNTRGRRLHAPQLASQAIGILMARHEPDRSVATSCKLWCALPERYNTRGRRLHAPQLASQAIGILMARHEPDRSVATSCKLWCALPERYNTRGRRLHAPQLASQAIGILMARHEPDSLQIPAFPVYTRSGEVRVSVEHVPAADVRVCPRRAKLVRRFMRFVFADVLRVRRRGMRLQSEGSTHNNYYIVPTVKTTNDDGTNKIDIDWAFLELIYQHTEEKKLSDIEKPLLWQENQEEEQRETSHRRRRGKKKMANPLLKRGEVFVFDAEKYSEAVVTPWYRNQDQPQFFLVAEICWNLTPDSSFPSATHQSFRDYYSTKYGVSLTQREQPLLDVDHTSARLNLLTPRYVWTAHPSPLRP